MAARRRSRRPGPKTISRTGVTGQKGVNLIEGVVLDVESRWTPSGPNEVGIDGYVELFDPRQPQCARPESRRSEQGGERCDRRSKTDI